MSEVLEAKDSEPLCCASCGVTGSDAIKLKLCTACKLVRYCGIKCQKKHRSQHKRACKERAAELHDEILFRQPEGTYLGDCPICCLPNSIEMGKVCLTGCCGKMICQGCSYADNVRQVEKSMDRVCLFCRHPLPSTDEENRKLLMKRVEANDPLAIVRVGHYHYKEGDIDAAIKSWTKAAELGSAEGHYSLSTLYQRGIGVEQNWKKTIYHLEQAAIAGHAHARHNLGCVEKDMGRFQRAVKHFVIASNLGHDSMQELRVGYATGELSKQDFATAIRAHQAAIDATKSVQRSEAAAALGG